MPPNCTPLPPDLQTFLRPCKNCWENEERRKNLGKLHWFISKWPTFIFMYMRDFIRTTTRKLEWNLTFPHRSAVMFRLPRVLNLPIGCWMLIEKNVNRDNRSPKKLNLKTVPILQVSLCLTVEWFTTFALLSFIKIYINFALLNFQIRHFQVP